MYWGQVQCISSLPHKVTSETGHVGDAWLTPSMTLLWQALTVKFTERFCYASAKLYVLISEIKLSVLLISVSKFKDLLTWKDGKWSLNVLDRRLAGHMRNDLPISSASCSQDVVLPGCKLNYFRWWVYPETSDVKTHDGPSEGVGLHKVRGSCKRCLDHMHNVTD